MKQTIQHARRSALRIYRPESPKDASRIDAFQKWVDIVTSTVSAAGFVSAMVFLATIA